MVTYQLERERFYGLSEFVTARNTKLSMTTEIIYSLCCYW
jgi:hypothetical protein